MDFIRAKKTTLTFDMAPLIDIVFLLLIFFMLSSSFLSPLIKVNLPKAVTQDPRSAERVVVSVDIEKRVFVNRLQTDWESLKFELQKQLEEMPRKSVDIKADEEVPYKIFVKAMDMARQAGATQVNLVHEVQK